MPIILTGRRGALMGKTMRRSNKMTSEIEAERLQEPM